MSSRMKSTPVNSQMMLPMFEYRMSVVIIIIIYTIGSVMKYCD